MDEEGTRPCITAVLQDHVLLIKFLTIFPLPIYNAFVHEIVFEIVSNCFSRNRWIVQNYRYKIIFCHKVAPDAQLINFFI